MEIWEDVVDYEEYFSVSSYGRMWSKRTNKILNQVLSPTGYYLVATKIGGRGGKNKTFRVHREVARAFLENPEDKPLVNHIDGIKTNNCVTNLEWSTYKENARHAWDTGLMENCRKIGESNTSSKLTENSVRFIRDNYKGWSRTVGSRALARKFGVSHSTVLDVINNTKWAPF